MPPKSSQSNKPPSKGPKGLTRLYLILYNALSFSLWATCTLRGAYLFLDSVILPATTTDTNLSIASAANASLPHIFADIFSPLLLSTQTLATLEILHSLLGLVRAPIVTTAMQVASRILVVWGVMYLFGGEGGIVGNAQNGAQLGDWAFLGCLSAWGVTECIRYGFFALQVLGTGVPGWWTWLRYFFSVPFSLSLFVFFLCLVDRENANAHSWVRYNTFYILYPLGITSECILVVKALAPAGEMEPLYRWFLMVVLGIYVPGMFPFLYWLIWLMLMKSRLLYPVHAYDCAAEEGAEEEG